MFGKDFKLAVSLVSLVVLLSVGCAMYKPDWDYFAGNIGTPVKKDVYNALRDEAEEIWHMIDQSVPGGYGDARGNYDMQYINLFRRLTGEKTGDYGLWLAWSEPYKKGGKCVDPEKDRRYRRKTCMVAVRNIPHIIERYGVLLGTFKYHLMLEDESSQDIQDVVNFILKGAGTYGTHITMQRGARNKIEYVARKTVTGLQHVCKTEAGAGLNLCDHANWQDIIVREISRLDDIVGIGGDIKIKEEMPELAWLRELNRNIRELLGFGEFSDKSANDKSANWQDEGGEKRVRVVGVEEIKQNLTNEEWYNLTHYRPMNDYLRKQVEADMPEGWLNRKEERVVRTIYRLANGAQFISDFARAEVYYYISNGQILRWESKDVNRDPIQVARQIVRGGVETFV